MARRERLVWRIVGTIRPLTLILVGAGILLLSTVMTALPAFAQEGETPVPTAAPAGVGVLILLVGIGALLFVGAYYVSLGRPQTAGRTTASADEDEYTE